MTLKALYNSFAVHPEGSWIMRWENAQTLFNLVKNKPIKKILDLGTGIGCSASVMAFALQEKGETDWQIDSVEQFDKCIKLAAELIPAEFRDKINAYKANPIVWQTPEIPYQYFSTYDSLPENEYDLIVNDGPGPFMESSHYVDLPNGTIIKLLLEEKIKPGMFIVWDGRLAALRFLERYFGSNFYLIPPERQGSDFNVIERKDNPVKCEDVSPKMMYEVGYFKGIENNAQAE